MITYTEEVLDDVITEIVPLTFDHYEEVGSKKIRMNVDWGRYCDLQREKLLFVMIVRDQGKLIGYMSYLIQSHLRYGILMAVADVFFLDASYRNSPIGLKMFKQAEKMLKAKGAKAIVNHCKVSNDFGKIFLRMGYQPLERNFIKYLI